MGNSFFDRNEITYRLCDQGKVIGTFHPVKSYKKEDAEGGKG
ncbi:hypothetical protein [Oceanobacillus limi]|nr:hypothetical protein [Oceanobacillus limi]